MLEFYDSSPWSPYIQQTRLKPACALSKAYIKCLVWGTDALAYIHFIPTGLFALQLVVADQEIQQASTEIMESLPYKICTSIPDPYIEPIFFNPNRPTQFPHSVHLEPTSPHDKRDIDDPDMVIIHPQSQLYLDVHDKSRSVSLPPFPDTIRFPTRTAFIDSMIETYLDPPTGQVHTKMKEMMSGWMSYFLLYTLRNHPRVLPNGDLEPEHAEVLQSLRPENQPYFEFFTHGGTFGSDRIVHAMRRKDILEKLGCTL
ncbi:hypothetical protein BYT27DRAFT_6443463 [Phlegmacium glaucopus]|nr:hypothetical protein BYT27DRAFT_6443463 [Phlegmacium glaucopus]